jgi:predicted TIM-barrel fold metal-dependent hydrolase
LPIFDAHCYLGDGVVPGVANNASVITAAMQARGVDAAVLLSAHARRADPAAGNRVLKAMLEQGQNLYGCLVTHVNRVEASMTAMRELMPGRKFVGMAVSGMRPDDFVQKIVADEIVNAYRRYSKPLFLFTPNENAVQAGLEIAKGYPMLKVVFLGMGGADWRAAVAAAHAATNVYLETSGVLDRAKLPAAVAALGAHRLLFGSGFPHVDTAAALGLIEDSDLSEEARRKILSDNARRLFGFEPGNENSETAA